MMMGGGGGGGGPMGGSGGGPMGGMGFGGRVKRFFFINTFSERCPFKIYDLFCNYMFSAFL
jgi:hypothetical protein